MSRVCNLTKAQLCAALDAAEVAHPSTATVAQLRVLYDEIYPQPIAEAQQHNVNEQRPVADVAAAGIQPIEHKEADENDDVIVAQLRRQREILELCREIRALEQEGHVAPPQRRAEFADVEHALPPFSGDDSYGVGKWIIDSEEVMIL